MSKIQLPPSVSVKEFAKRLDKSVPETIKTLMDNGFIATINEELDYDTAAIIALDLGFEVEKEKQPKDTSIQDTFGELSKMLVEDKAKISVKSLKKRPPIVTILGHVDHGKTTLLDTIRRTKVAEGESGGITQHITAYQVKVKGKTITFVDTPGHEAFQRMRARGASVADIAIIIIAADDGVKPQTKEVLKNIKESQLPFIICLNKIDKPEANVEKVKGQLADAGVLVEGWGGKVPLAEISAKHNKNIDDLLETILLVAEIEDLTTVYEKPALGLVLESHLDKKRGPIATVIVKSGTLRPGDLVIANNASGKIKMLEDFAAKKISRATPGMPVTILGFNRLPTAGSVISVTSKDKKYLKQRKAAKRTQEAAKSSSPLKRIEESIETDKYKKLNVVIKADTQGSLEAIKQILESLTIEDVVIKIIRSGVGQITESDILLAKVSDAIVYGFRVTASLTAKEVQEKEKVKPRFFDVIYHLTANVQEEMEKIVTIPEVRVEQGKLNVLAIFRTDKNDMIVGGKVTEGKLNKDDQLELVREGEIVARGKLTQLKKGKENFKECLAGEECGITFEFVGPVAKIRENDQIVSFVITKK